MSEVANVSIWNESQPLGLPPLEGEVTAEVCVIGLGGTGLSCLRELRELGVEAVGVDAGVVGNGAAGRNGGFLLAGLPDFHHRAVEGLGRERAAGLYRATLEELERLAAESAAEARITGSLRIAADEAELDDCRAHLEALEADGLPGQWYEGDEGRGLLIPSDGVYQPSARCRALARELDAAGVRLFQYSAVERIRTNRVFCPRGEVRCERIIIAVDGGLERLVPDLEGRVRTARLQMLATGPETRVSFERPIYSRWGYDFWRQLPDGRIALGGMRDQGGEEEWTVRAVPSDTVQRQLNYLLHRIGVRAAVTHRWAAVAAYTRDAMPVFEEVGDRVLALGGYSGTGNVIGAMLGREAAGWAVGREAPWRRLLAGA